MYVYAIAMSFFRTDFSEIWPCRRKLWVTWILAAFCRAFVLKLLTVWRKRKRSWGRYHLAQNRTLPIFTWLKACACVVKSLKSQCWKVSSEKIHCNGVNVHLCKFLKQNIQPFKTYFSMYEHLFTESHLQGFKTGKQWNTLLEQCQIWNSANALVILFELWKCVGENDSPLALVNTRMRTDIIMIHAYEFLVLSIKCRWLYQ